MTLPYKAFLDDLSYVVNVALVAGWIYRLLTASIRQRLVQSFFGGDAITIYLPLRGGAAQRKVIADEDFVAAMELADFLRSHGMTVRHRRIPPVGTFDFDPKSIVICGPKSCEAVQRFYSSDPSYTIEHHNSRWEIHDCVTGNYLVSPMDQQPPEDKDLAYFGRVSTGPQGDLLLLGGIHAAGSYGAIRFLTNFRKLRKLLKETGHDRFSTVLMTTFSSKAMSIISSEILLSVRRRAVQ